MRAFKRRVEFFSVRYYFFASGDAIAETVMGSIRRVARREFFTFASKAYTIENRREHVRSD